MNGGSSRQQLRRAAILGAIVIRAALACSQTGPANPDAGSSNDATAGHDSSPTCPCAPGELCMFQIGGPVLPAFPTGRCEVPDPACIQRIEMSGTVVSACVCLAASEGPCSPGDDVDSCTCDNGIR